MPGIWGHASQKIIDTDSEHNLVDLCITICMLHYSSNTVVYAGVTEPITNCYEYINNLDYDCFIIEYLSVLMDQQKAVGFRPHQVNLLVGFEDSLLCLNDSSTPHASYY